MNKVNKVVRLKQIKTWSQYVITKSKTPTKPHAPKFPIDDKINSKISLWQGDITHLHVDAIVNAANEAMRGGGGVDGAIHAAAGPKLLEECIKVGKCKKGSAKLTGGYNLPSNSIIHTVGPTDPKGDSVLQSAYQSSLNLALENGFASIAFPCIATGIYGFPEVPAAHIASETVREFMNKNGKVMERVIFVMFNEKQTEIYENVLPIYFPKSSNSSTPSTTSKTSVKSRTAAQPKPRGSSR